jgi:hypothetical protein
MTKADKAEKPDTARIGRNVERMISLKAPEEDIDTYLGTEGFTPETFRAAMIERAPKPVNALDETGAIGAAAGRVLYGAAGAPVDIVNAGLNLVGLGSQNPVGGSQWIQDRAGNVVDIAKNPLAAAQADGAGNRAGLIPGLGPLARLLPEATPTGPTGADIVAAEPQTAGGRIAGRALGEVAAAAVPMAGLFGRATQAAQSGLREAPTIGQALRNSFAGTSNTDRAAQLVASAGAGLGAGAANELAPGSAVADFAGGLLGGAGTGLGMYGAGSLRNVFAPLMSTEARRDVAGETLRQFATNPDALVGAPLRVLPSSPLTTAQAALDPGLASLERTLRSQPEAGPKFADRDALRAQAQRRNMQRLAPSGGGAEDVAAMVRGRLGQFDQRTGQRVANAQGAVDQRMGQLGPGLGPVEAGTAVREELGAARTAAKQGESNLWNRLQDNEDLALEVGAGPANARKMLGEISPSAKPPSGDAAGVLEAAANLGGVVRWRELQDLRSWAAQTSSDLARAGDAVNKRRVDAVLRGLDDDIARAVGPDDAPGSPAGGTPSAPRGGGPSGTPSGPAAGPAPSGAVFTPDGQRIETDWRLVDLAGPDAPVVSHTPDFRPNPDYPQALQPRNRDRAASEAQVVRMAGELNPERLGAGGVGDGAPIIGPDRVTESGNGRLLAIDRAYRNGGRPAEQYRAWVESQGFPTAGMDRPALVRVRTNELNDADRARWTEGANAGPGLKLSPAEQAAVDARRVGDDTLSLYRGGALDDAGNVDFARAFVKQAAPGDAGTLSTASGQLSLEGVRRMQAAMLHKVYGDAQRATGDAGSRGIVQTLLETGDDNIKSLGRALADTAPQMAQLRAAIARGDVPAQFDPVATITDAARVVQRARSDGVPIGDVLAQADAFNPIDKNTAALLSAAYGDQFRRVSYGRATEALRTYADEALRQTGGDMFGPGPAAGDVWAAAQRRARGIGDDAPDQAKLGGLETAAPPPGGSGGSVPPGGPAAGAGAGLGPSGARPNSGGGGGSAVVGDGLTPNFGPEDAARYRAARAATAERKQTFDRGAPGQALQKGGYNARGENGYAMPVEQVAGKFFNAGRSSATDMAEFLRAAEGRGAAVQALRDYAVGDLRRVAVDDAGRVDPKRWAAWVAKHDAPLRSFPEVRRDLSNVAAAQRSLDRVTGLRDQTVQGFEKSSAGQFLAKDPDAAFASVIRSDNRTQGLTQLVRMAKGDEGKLGQLRRAAVEHMLRSVENTGSVDALMNQSLSPAKTVRFMAINGKALQKSGLLTPGQIAVLRRVEEDMKRAVYAQTVGRAVGSNTYQNLAAGSVLGQITMGYGKRNGLLANTIGRAGNWMYKIADREVQALVTDAMLDPTLARDLMARATPDRMLWLNEALKRRAIATGLVSAATSQAAD